MTSNWETATFPRMHTMAQTHGGYGVYSGTAHSGPDGAEDGPWTVELRHGAGEGVTARVLHVRTVNSWRHAEYLLRAWVGERVAPEVTA